jgi:phosphatidylglycerophosphatase C
MEVTVAVFDVDGTLTVRDCVVPFTRRVAGTTRLIRGVLGQPKKIFSAVRSRDRDAMKAVFSEIAFTGIDATDLENHAITFADEVYSGWMRQDVARRFRWHQDQGHVVVLVSASFDAYLAPLGDLLEADAVLCTRLEIVDGVATGRLDGPNCRGAEKVRRIAQWCEESGLSLESVEYAYGDSKGDQEMLALARHGFYVAKDELSEAASC